ncbi:hypothetical protein FS749_008768 [Ceratobasidium sp. UAMH 11750]|nr:hypothetical protein FS749_008768 [Ceratobasidium sp. UAMH 11750]
MSRPDGSLVPPPAPPPKPAFPPHTGHLECCERKVYSAMDSLEALALTQNYYRIVFALLRGSERRPSLPVELVTRICQHINFISPNINKSLSDHRCCLRHRPKPRIKRCVYPISPPTINRVLQTKQISRSELRVLGGVEVLVETVDSPCWDVAPDDWEKFFIKIHRQGGPSSARTGLDTPEMVWTCFEPKDAKLEYPHNQRSDRPTGLKCRCIIDLSHEIWNILQPGDHFEVALIGHKWDNPEDNYEVVIRMLNRWEPSSAMLAFA